MNDQRSGSLSAEVVIGAGGWNRKFARILLIEENDGQAVVLVDGNGDGAELELEYWSQDAVGRWECRSSSGYSDISSLESDNTWNTGSYVVSLGKVEPGTVVRLSYAGNTHSRVANEFGIWGFIAPADPESEEEVPVVVP